MIDCRIKYGAETAAKPESRSPLKHKLIVAELPCTMQRDLGVTHARKDRVAAGAQTSSHSEISLIWPLYQTLSGCGTASKRRWTKRRAYGSWRSDVHSISLPPIPTPQMMYAYPWRYKNPYSSGVHILQNSKYRKGHTARRHCRVPTRIRVAARMRSQTDS